MVSDATLVAAIASVGGTVATVLTVASLWIWRHTTDLHDEDVEKIATLLDAEWERAGAALADFFTDTVAEMGREVGDDPPDLRLAFEHVVVQEMDDGDLNQLVDALENVGRGRDLHRSHRDAYKDAYGYFAAAAVVTMVDVLFGIVHFLDVVPSVDVGLTITVVGFASAIAVLWGMLSFRSGRQRKEEFVRAWESARLEE